MTFSIKGIANHLHLITKKFQVQLRFVHKSESISRIQVLDCPTTWISGLYICVCSDLWSGQRELCTPLVRHSTPIRHLGKKIEGHNSTLFHQRLNIISPGTHSFLRFEGSELTIFPPDLKERPGIRHHCC
jgi:hypothetical protein